jgi:hypothetical protein
VRVAIKSCLLALGAVTLGVVGAAWADHGDGGGEGEPYVPPPVEPVPPQHGNFWKVAAAFRHEVWLVDQSNSPGKTYGGALHIYQDEDVRRDAGTASSEIVDLGGQASALCLAETGANPVRPHMLTFNSTGSHGILSFVASGHVVIFDGPSRQAIECFRTEVGAGGARQAHAIWPSPDDSYLLVANQNGKKLERIQTDYANDTFYQEPLATLNLATCTTPNGLPCQDPALRPDNAPICPYVPSNGFPAYISLRGGGMLAVDPRTSPMQIVAEYDTEHIPRDGCGFTQASGWVFGGGGGGNPANPDGWLWYRVPQAGPELYKATNLPNTPEPQVIVHDDSAPRDAHGVARSKQQKYAYFFDRAGNVVEIYETLSGAYVKTENLVSPFSADPTVDLAGESPDGKYVYLSTRGPNPLSGDPHASTGSTPGLLVLELRGDGRDVVVRGLAPITNLDAGGVERADGHGIRVRPLSCQ